MTGDGRGGESDDSYLVLDSGDGRRLERAGPWLLDRQASQAFWPKTLPEAQWRRADAVHHRSEKGGGHWEFRTRLPESWSVALGGLRLEVRPTPFGHLGLFAEHAGQWEWMRAAIGSRPNPPSVLNLFAYTGGATLACAAAGAEVCHVDAARGVIEWAQRNARANGLDSRPIRWIVEDCAAFVEREARRGRRYDAILLDPPTYGRGARKEVWKIEDDLLVLLRACRSVLSEAPLFVLLSCHTPGWSPIVLANLLEATIPAGGSPEHGELAITEHAGRRLPSGAFARLSFDGPL